MKITFSKFFSNSTLHFSNQKPFTPLYQYHHPTRKMSIGLNKSLKKDMTAIFLDIDGVIFYNPMNGMVQQQIKERFKGKEHELPLPYPSIECDKAAVDLFDKSALHYLDKLIQNITKETKKEAGIILSSAWRERRTMPFLKDLFRQHSFSNYIIDKTPEIFKPRNKEIAQWLSENQDKYNLLSFVILDDYDDGLSQDFPEQFVKCEHRKLFGALECEQALTIALKPWKSLDYKPVNIVR